MKVTMTSDLEENCIKEIAELDFLFFKKRKLSKILCV